MVFCRASAGVNRFLDLQSNLLSQESILCRHLGFDDPRLDVVISGHKEQKSGLRGVTEDYSASGMACADLADPNALSLRNDNNGG